MAASFKNTNKRNDKDIHQRCITGQAMRLIKPLSMWSLSALATEFGMDRRKCGQLLEGVVPAGENRKNPVYHIADVALILATYKNNGTYLKATSGNDEFDPEQLPPKERKEHYEGTLKKMEIELKNAQLVPAAQHREGLADMAKIVKTALTGLADTVDEELDLPPAAIEAIDDVSRKVLESIAREMIAE